MLKKVVATICLLAIVTAGIVYIGNRSHTPVRDTSKVTVAASFYPLYEFARQVGGNDVRVTNITPPTAEPHDFEPPAKILADTSKAAVFIYNGASFEPWTASFVRDYEGVIIKASNGVFLSEGHHDHREGVRHPGSQAHTATGETDPHFWLDPVWASQVVDSITLGLIQADPGHATDYKKRAAAYQGKLMQLDAAFRKGLEQCDQKTIVASHGAFSYVAQRYGFHVESIAGIRPDQEPDVARLAELATIVKEKHIPVVFFESLVSPRLADTIAKETGARIAVLDPVEGLSDEAKKEGKNYLSIQRENLANLRSALACR